jgi:hypothetical protein
MPYCKKTTNSNVKTGGAGLRGEVGSLNKRFAIDNWPLIGGWIARPSVRLRSLTTETLEAQRFKSNV